MRFWFAVLAVAAGLCTAGLWTAPETSSFTLAGHFVVQAVIVVLFPLVAVLSVAVADV